MEVLRVVVEVWKLEVALEKVVVEAQFPAADLELVGHPMEVRAAEPMVLMASWVVVDRRELVEAQAMEPSLVGQLVPEVSMGQVAALAPSVGPLMDHT